jgi:hypothetical protein
MDLRVDPGESASEDLGKKLLLALEMFDFGVAIKEQSLRRDHPELSDEEVKERLREWLHTRPGAEFGDAPGKPVSLE